MAEKNFFQELCSVDLNSKIKTKNGSRFVPWATAWAELKKRYPLSEYYVHRSFTNDFWFVSGDKRSSWVEVTVTVPELEKQHTEVYPILNNKNQDVPGEVITASIANKAVRRALAKAVATLSGIGIFVYEGEDIPDETKEIQKLQKDCIELINRKCALSDKAKTETGKVCNEILADEKGSPKLCDDVERLTKLKRELQLIHK